MKVLWHYNHWIHLLQNVNLLKWEFHKRNSRSNIKRNIAIFLILNDDHIPLNDNKSSMLSRLDAFNYFVCLFEFSMYEWECVPVHSFSFTVITIYNDSCHSKTTSCTIDQFYFGCVVLHCNEKKTFALPTCMYATYIQSCSQTEVVYLIFWI